MKESRGLALLLFAFLLFSSSLARRLSSATGQATFINGTCFITATPPPTTTMASPVPPASSSSPVPPSPASPSRRPTLLTGLRVGFAAGVVAVVVAVAVLLIYCGKKNRQPLVPTPSAPHSSGMRIFTLDEIKQCTKNFASSIGRGGCGRVYHGVLSNGKEVAVKKLNEGDGQNDFGFETEVENLRRAHHKHVVSLVGYCKAETRCFLVYEYVPKNTLDFHLHGHGDGRWTLDWPTRLKIALGSAKGLAYLHEDCHPKIIHRDIKATNILLDDGFEAKIADFGLAKCISESKTHVSTTVKGSTGYLAPEYVSSGQLTEKSDIYSFGVVLLELITGRKARNATDSRENPKALVDWVKPQLKRYLEDGNFDSLVDPGLQNYNLDEMARMVQCAAACVHPSGERRPKMSKIVQVLEGCRCLPLYLSPSDLNAGERQGLSSLLSGCKSSDCGTTQGLEMSRKTPLGNQKNGSSHHREPTPGSRRAGPSRPTAQGVEMRKM